MTIRVQRLSLDNTSFSTEKNKREKNILNVLQHSTRYRNGISTPMLDQLIHKETGAYSIIGEIEGTCTYALDQCVYHSHFHDHQIGLSCCFIYSYLIPSQVKEWGLPNTRIGQQLWTEMLRTDFLGINSAYHRSHIYKQHMLCYLELLKMREERKE